MYNLVPLSLDILHGLEYYLSKRGVRCNKCAKGGMCVNRHSYIALIINVLIACGAVVCALQPAHAEYYGPSAPMDIARQYVLEAQYDLAEEMLKEILVHDPDNREALLLLGTVLGQKGSRKEASGYLKRALYLDPEDPSANLELGRNFLERGVPKEAMDYFERVMDLGDVAAPAQRDDAAGYIEQIKNAQRRESGYYINMLAGFQYDTNVPAFSDDIQTITGDEREDLRTTLNIAAQYDRPMGGVLEGSAGYAYYKSMYEDLSMYDTDLHIVTLKGTGKLNGYAMDLRYIYEYATMDGYRHTLTQGITPSIVFPTGGDRSIIVTYKYKDVEARDIPVSPANSGSSGHSQTAGMTLLDTMAGGQKMRAGYLYEDKDAVADSFSFLGHKAYLDAGFRISSILRATGYLEYYERNYSQVQPVSRVERRTTLSATLMRDYSRRVSGILSYTYAWNDSADWRYEYERAIASLLLKVRY